MTYYVGIIDGKPGTFGVRIPDCPGAFGAGDSVDAAMTSAINGLAIWVDAAIKDGETLPNPRSFAELFGDPEDGPAPDEMMVLVPLLRDAGRTVKANVTFDAGLLDMIDREAEQRGLTRSAFLASAAREKIAASGFDESRAPGYVTAPTRKPRRGKI